MSANPEDARLYAHETTTRRDYPKHLDWIVRAWVITRFAISSALPFVVSAVIAFFLVYFTYVYKTSVQLRDDLTKIQDTGFTSKAERVFSDWSRLKSSSSQPVNPSSFDPSEYYSELADLSRFATRSADDHRKVQNLLNVASLRKIPNIFQDDLVQPVSQDRLSHGYFDTPSDVQDPDIDFISFVKYLSIIDEASVPISSFDEIISGDISVLQNIITFYGLWILPALYALFGMMVFYFRSLINPDLHTPRRPFVRAALTIIAGVSVSWLVNSFDATQFGGLSVFTVAFLFGFSLDVFFNTLDRIVAHLAGTARAAA